MTDTTWLRQMIDRYMDANFTINRSTGAIIRELMPEGLTTEQFLIMCYLHKKGSCTSTELSEIFHVGKSTITALIGRLADKSFIRRVPDLKDRRVSFLQLTEAGIGLTAELNARMDDRLSQVLIQFEESEAAEFMRNYERLAKALGQAAQGEFEPKGETEE